MQTLKVKRSGIIRFPSSAREGAVLVSAKVGEAIPFAIREAYFITKLGRSNARGAHAHKKRHQVIVCAHGSFSLVLDDGTVRQTLRMSNPTVGIRLGPLLWHEMKSFSKDCVIIVFADATHNDADYIRDYHDFLARSKKKA